MTTMISLVLYEVKRAKSKLLFTLISIITSGKLFSHKMRAKLFVYKGRKRIELLYKRRNCFKRFVLYKIR